LRYALAQHRTFGMELFLNLCWLSLLLPAYLLWRQRSCSALAGRAAGRITRGSAVAPLVFLCALACAILLLFPVISASDDLHAMRAEMEESSLGKRSVSQAGTDSASVSHSRSHNLTALITTTPLSKLKSLHRLELLAASLSTPVAPSLIRASRAPPISHLA
jgi:hypothetical protein